MGAVPLCGRQDKSNGPRVCLSGCLHIEKHGAKHERDGVVVGGRARKRLILLGGSGWQAGGDLAPDAFKPLNR